jgi:hypothetical protein
LASERAIWRQLRVVEVRRAAARKATTASARRPVSRRHIPGIDRKAAASSAALEDLGITPVRSRSVPLTRVDSRCGARGPGVIGSEGRILPRPKMEERLMVTG